MKFLSSRKLGVENNFYSLHHRIMQTPWTNKWKMPLGRNHLLLSDYTKPIREVNKAHLDENVCVILSKIMKSNTHFIFLGCLMHMQSRLMNIANLMIITYKTLMKKMNIIKHHIINPPLDDFWKAKSLSSIFVYIIEKNPDVIWHNFKLCTNVSWCFDLLPQP